MYISFFPTLNSHTRVPVCAAPDGGASLSEPVRAAFRARLSARDYAEAISAGVRIELWTDAPSDAKRGGEWGAVAFEEVPTCAEAGRAQTLSSDGHDAASELHVSFESDTASKNDTSEKRGVHAHTFRAALSLPRSPGKMYHFTYRLVYPSGVCWLGSDRDNGALELGAGTEFFEASGSWEQRGVERVRVTEEGREDGAVVAGKLDIDGCAWSGWALDGSRAWSFTDLTQVANQQARLIYLVPVLPEDAVLIPQAHVFRATSWVSPISISPQGQVNLHYSGQGTVEHRVHDVAAQDNLRLLHSEIISSCPAPEILHSKNTSNELLFTPNNDSDVSTTIYALPLTTTPSRTVSVPIQNLDIFANNASSITLFSQETRGTLFIDRPNYSDADLTLHLGTGGGQFVVSAAYDLTDSGSSSGKWYISLPFHTVRPRIMSASVLVENVLPTPPASPPPKTRRTVSFVLPSNDDMEENYDTRQSSSPSEEGDVGLRPGGSRNALGLFQFFAGGRGIKAQLLTVLKLLARLMGVAILRLILFTFRAVAGPKAQAKRTGKGKNNNDETSSAVEDEVMNTNEVQLQEKSAHSISFASDYRDNSLSRSGTEIAAPPVQTCSTLSTTPELEGTETSSCHLTRPGPEATTFKWVLPAGVEPITLVVHSTTEQPRAPRLHIELDEVIVRPSTAVDVKKGTGVFMVERSHAEALTLLIKLKN
ncbi:hypothetical protein DFH11DRAFT_1500367 [Phellopilus nigrolimitatus]|nr:hypothetical protein DFH11DRAFT_1500367 [Phellopilus nigrolimitatus]